MRLAGWVMLTGSGQFGPKATVSHYRTLKGVRSIHLSFQKIVLKTFGEWPEGKVRLNIVEQVQRLLLKSMKELIVISAQVLTGDGLAIQGLWMWAPLGP